MIVFDGLSLPSGLLWSDEFAAAGVAQTLRRALDGTLVVFYGGLRAGQAITLESEADAGWLTRALVEAIALRAASPGGVFALSLRQQTYTVMFRHHDPPAFEARPLVNVANPGTGDFYRATLKFLTL